LEIYHHFRQRYRRLVVLNVLLLPQSQLRSLSVHFTDLIHFLPAALQAPSS